MLDEEAKQNAAGLGIDNPPAVSPIRLVSPDQWADAQLDCLQSAGFDVSYTPDGEGVQYPEVQDPGEGANLNLAIYTCQAQYPVSPIYSEPLTNSQLEFLYEYRTTELLACLDSEGYTVADGAPPSKTTFVQDGGVWSPYESVSIPLNELAAVRKACPESGDYSVLLSK